MSEAAIALTRGLLECADWLKEATALTSEHSIEAYAPIWIAPHQARKMAEVIELAAVHIGREIPQER